MHDSNHPKTPSSLCPLCKGAANFYHQDTKREYHQCETCSLVFVLPEYYLTPSEEKFCYDTHQNDPEDLGYRRFLSRLTAPLIDRLPSNAHGLDIGSGPGPTLSLMLEEADYEMSIYDPFYANDLSVFDKRYDFLTCTEVIEHVHNPHDQIKQWLALIPKGGIIGLMTKLVISPERFSLWHYKNDPTHVCFYSKDTFNWLANKYLLEVEFIADDVIILSKTC